MSKETDMMNVFMDGALKIAKILAKEVPESDHKTQTSKHPHKCPVCGGRGHTAFDENCVACSGKGIIWG